MPLGLAEPFGGQVDTVDLQGKKGILWLFALFKSDVAGLIWARFGLVTGGFSSHGARAKSRWKRRTCPRNMASSLKRSIGKSHSPNERSSAAKSCVCCEQISSSSTGESMRHSFKVVSM